MNTRCIPDLTFMLSCSVLVSRPILPRAQCRGYTPQLSDEYKAFAQDGEAETSIVFVSSNQDEAGFNQYYGSMSFYGLTPATYLQWN